MQNQPQQPLDELETLRKHLHALLNEVYVVRATVEAIYSRKEQAGALINALKACHITLVEDEQDSEIIHVYRHDKRIQTFSSADWQWQYDDGTWPWQLEQSNLFLEADLNME